MQAALSSCSRGSAPCGFVLTLAALCSRLRLRAHARGGVPPLRRWGALRTEPPLRTSTYAAGRVPAPQTGRLEDGAPAPRECLRPE